MPESTDGLSEGNCLMGGKNYCHWDLKENCSSGGGSNGRSSPGGWRSCSLMTQEVRHLLWHHSSGSIGPLMYFNHSVLSSYVLPSLFIGNIV